MFFMYAAQFAARTDMLALPVDTRAVMERDRVGS